MEILKESDDKTMVSLKVWDTHTLGNMIRSRILKSQNVLFASYKQPEFLSEKTYIIINIRTNTTTTWKDELFNTCEELCNELESLRLSLNSQI